MDATAESPIRPHELTREASLYDLVERLCTVDQILDLMRRERGDLSRHPDIQTTYTSKTSLVQTQLRHAVEAKAIPEAKVYGLLERAEENGNQYVFYYVPRTQKLARQHRDGERVAEVVWRRRWDESWRQKMGFPRLRLVPESYTWADFKIGLTEKGGGYRKPKDWSAKLYGHETHLRYTGNQTVDGHYLYRQYEVEEERSVCLARYNRGGDDTPDLLEIRVPRSTSRRLIERRRDEMWEKLAPAMSKGDFTPWELTPARRRLLEQQDRHRDLYSIGDARLRDTDSGVAVFSPYTEDENLFSAQEREEAIMVLLRGQSECRQLVVVWQTTGAPELVRKDVFPDEVRTVLGDRETHEVVVMPNTTPEVIDHVTDQLRRFNR